MPAKGVYQLPYQLEEKKKKMELLAYSNFSNQEKASLLKRIHITGDNIFSDINNIANREPKISKAEQILEKTIKENSEVN